VEKNEKQNLINKLDNANKEISSHFIEEIKKKKEIINTENKIDHLEKELKETEFEFNNIGMAIDEKPAQLRKKELRDAIKRLSEDITSQKILLSDLSIQFNELVKKREDLKILISMHLKEPLGQSLQLAFQNYLVELENLDLDQKKKINIKNLRNKEVKVNKFIDQIKLRDQLIEHMKAELHKKGIKMKENEKLKNLENLNIENKSLYASEQISNPKILPQNNYYNDIPKISETNNKYFKKIIHPKFKSRSNSPRDLNFQAYNHPNIKKEKVKIKTKATELINRAKRKELTEIRMHMINDMYPNSKIFYLNSYNQRILKENSIPIQTNLLKSEDSFHSLNNKSHHSNLNTSFKEREIDKKVKGTLLKKKPIINSSSNKSFDRKYLK